MNEHLQVYLEYLDNAGNVTADQFDDDHEPIGPMVREELFRTGLAQVDCGLVVRTVDVMAVRLEGTDDVLTAEERDGWYNPTRLFQCDNCGYWCPAIENIDETCDDCRMGDES